MHNTNPGHVLKASPNPAADHQTVRAAEAGALVERDRPIARAQHDTREVVLVRVPQNGAEELRTDASIAVGSHDERIAEVAPAAWRVPWARHPFEDR